MNFLIALNLASRQIDQWWIKVIDVFFICLSENINSYVDKENILVL